jgi:hypothetical protein
MKLKTSLFTFSFLFFAMTLLAQKQAYPPSPTPDRIILTWAEDPHTTQSVTWRTDVSVRKAIAEIALADGSPDFIRKTDTVEASSELLVNDYIKWDYSVAQYHSATFRNLNPSTKYAYRVGDGKNWSEWFHFTTGGKKTDPISFLYFGDAQNAVKSLWSRVIREAYSTMPKIDFMLHAGDLINRCYIDKEWGEWAYAAGWINGMVSSIATPGNHEYRDKEFGKRDYKTRELTKYWKPSFAFPENGPAGFDALKESAYYIDYQDLRIISINNVEASIYMDAAVAQKEWLEKVLSDNPQKWTIITHHYPLYASSKGRNQKELRDFFQPVYEKHKVDLVLQGHDHSYSRGTNKSYGAQYKGDTGPVYVVSVSGPKMYETGFFEWADRTASNVQLYQLINIDGDLLRYEAYTAVGQLYDAFEIKKNAAGNNIFADKTPADVEELIYPSIGRMQRWSPQDSIDFKTRFELYKERKKNREE